MSTNPPSAPVKFDQLVFADAQAVRENLGRRGFEDPLDVVRYAYATFVQGDREAAEQALADLECVNVAPARGVRLMLQVLLGEYEAVAKEEMAPEGATPEQWECACHVASAIGIASAIRGDLERAHAHLLVALTLAKGLGLANRVQTLTIEWARVSGLRGQPQTQALREQLRSSMPQRRQAWNRRTLSESLMSEGLHQDALRELGTPESDTLEDAALREFLHVYNGLPLARPLPQESAHSYLHLAKAVRELSNGDAPTGLGDIRGEPQAGYAALIEAVVLVRTPKMAQQAVRLLGKRQFKAADQALTRAVTLTGAVAEGAHLHRGSLIDSQYSLIDLMELAIGGMKSTADFMALTRRISPERFTLLCLGPVGNQLNAVGLAAIPMVAGQDLLFNGQTHHLPGGAGRAAVLTALGLPADHMARLQKLRHTKALAEFPGRAVNLGCVVRGYERLAAAEAHLGHLNAAAAWNQAAERVLAMMTPDTLSEIMNYKSRS